jgi:hypothetical protein
MGENHPLPLLRGRGSPVTQLAQNGLWGHDQDAPGKAGNPGMAEVHSCFDCLSQPHLIGYEKAHRFIVQHTFVRSQLVGPGFHRAGPDSHKSPVQLPGCIDYLFPGLSSFFLTDKDREAVANPARFKDLTKVSGTGGAHKRASRDYQERMQAIFAECRRVLKKDGLMVLMFTHKATGAWDALAMGLLEAGFEITASWPINTEAEGSLHIKDKNAAKSTIFLGAARGKASLKTRIPLTGRTWNPW